VVLQAENGPHYVGTTCHDGPLMRTRDTSPDMAGEQQAGRFHQSVDPFGVDGTEAGGSVLALEERGDPPVSIGRPGDQQVPDIGHSGAALGTTLAAFARCSLNQNRTGDPEGLCDPLHGLSSGNCDRDSKVVFYPCKIQSLFEISSSMVLRPSRRSSSRTRSSSCGPRMRRPHPHAPAPEPRLLRPTSIWPARAVAT
jgi:hypothetical protein